MADTYLGTAPRPLPFVSGARGPMGHYEEFCATPIEFLQRAYDECGELAEFDLGGLRTVLMVGPQAHEAFFRAPEEQLNAAAAYQMMVPVFGEGVQYGAEPHIERQQLKIQSLGLRYDRMSTYQAILGREVADFVADWGDAGEFDFYDAFTDLTLKTSTHCLLGSDLRYRLTGEFSELYRDLEHGIDPSALLDPNQQKDAFTKRDIARARLQDLITEAVRERRAKGVQLNDMLQVYMDARYEDGSGLTDNEITGMVIWFMFAGHHTSSNTAAWTLLEICRHAQFADELRNEIDELYRQNQQQSMNAPKLLPLLEGFMREALRLHPPLNAISRRVMQPFAYKDFVVDPGKNVMICPHTSHRLADYFPDPERFDPKRPQPENIFAAVPFGAGRHKCVGNAFALLQVRTILAALLHEFDFSLTQPAETYREIMPALILRPTTPCGIRYQRRTH